jgi:hypothetical protein
MQMHRTILADPSLEPVKPENIVEMLSPNITILGLPRTDLRITGPYEKIIAQFLQSFNIELPSDQVVVPCLSRQLPSIQQKFPKAVIIHSNLYASALANMRTVVFSMENQFPYHLKLALACRITSALRTITPWSAVTAPEISELLVKLVPTNLWVYREVASVVGSQKNYDEAKHLACIFRENLEERAEKRGETLMIAGALSQIRVDGSESCAERLFGLDTMKKKLAWFKKLYFSIPTSC